MKTETHNSFLVLFFLVLIVISCNKRVNNDATNQTPQDRISIPKFGTTNTFEIATWNIENFGNSSEHNTQLQIIDVVEIINDLDIDLFAVQEIGSQSAFDSVANRLEEYDGFLAGFSGNLRTGIFFRKSLISILKDTLLFINDSYSFPRPPLMLYLEASKNNISFDFYLIVLHLKASSSDPNEEIQNIARRRSAVLKLEQFINTKIQQGSDHDYIVTGDWNDKLDDDPTQNVFNPFLNQPQSYTFLTLPFAGSLTEYTYIAGSFKSLIDHIMITSSIDTAYSNETQIIKVDQFFSQYLAEVSDHRPVASKFFVF